MTTFKQLRKAFGWRYELLCDEDGSWLWGEYEDLDEDGIHVYELVRVVEVEGVYCLVETSTADLSDYELACVTEAAEGLARNRREYEDGDHGDY